MLGPEMQHRMAQAELPTQSEKGTDAELGDADPAYYSSAVAKVAREARAAVSITVRRTRRSKQRSQRSAMMHGLASNASRRSATKRPEPGFRRLKAKAKAPPGRTHCSICSATVRSSPPSTGNVSTLSLLIKSIGSTRSSSKSMRCRKTVPWRICPPVCSTPILSGWPSPRSRTTCCALRSDSLVDG